MAKLKRSVWEVRFYALKQYIGFREEVLRNVIAENVIEGKPTNNEYVHNVKLLKSLHKKQAK